MNRFRRPTLADRCLDVLDQARSLEAPGSAMARANPADHATSPTPSARDRRLIAGLMRINHTGEVCAQALYQGQAAVAESADTRAHLEQAAREEHDHLRWCAQRLAEIEARPSVLNPLWYAGSYLIGASAALFGDRVSLGFVVETERQVEAHLDDHLERLPLADARSRAILATMQREEVEHGQHALARGADELPSAIRRAMGLCADLMRFVAYRI
jgi:ubiquinone biosynthesis monooxygenase Coq7